MRGLASHGQGNADADRRAQAQVAGQVAEGVIDLLKAVDIESEHRHVRGRAGIAREHLLKRTETVLAVEHIGQGIRVHGFAVGVEAAFPDHGRNVE